jgi:hypothetical protein
MNAEYHLNNNRSSSVAAEASAAAVHQDIFILIAEPVK